MSAPLHAALAAIPSDTEPFARARLEAMLLGYHAMWENEDVEVLAVEHEFQFPLTRPDGTIDPDWIVGGAIDLIARWNGRLFIVDHKTSSEDTSGGSAYRQRLVMNGQISHYMLAAESLGLEPYGAIFDVLHKPAQRPLKAGKTRKQDETPADYRERCVEAILSDLPSYFDVVEVARLQADRETYLRDLYRVTTLIDTVRAYDLAPRSVDQCMSYGRECQFFGACAGVASLEDRTTYRRKPTIHAELRHPIPAGKRLITTSRRTAFQRCMEYERLAYAEGFERVQRDEALSFGTAMHLALQAYWEAWPRQDRRWLDAAA